MQCYRVAINRLEAAWHHRLACVGEAACRPTVKCYRWRRRTTDDDRRHRAKQDWPRTLCVGGPVTTSTWQGRMLYGRWSWQHPISLELSVGWRTNELSGWLAVVVVSTSCFFSNFTLLVGWYERHLERKKTRVTYCQKFIFQNRWRGKEELSNPDLHGKSPLKRGGLGGRMV